MVLSYLILIILIAPSLRAGTLNDEFKHSDEEAYFTEIASGHLEALRKAPGVVTVITADDIERSGATHLDEVLESVPGLHVNRSDLSRLEPVYSIRGIQNGFSAQALILFNSMEIKNPFSGGLPAVFRLPLNSISRIEIIKGASSALYGANAFSGVINIIPKKGQDAVKPVAQIRTGSFGSHDLTLQHHYTTEAGTGYFLSLEQQYSDGDNNRIIAQDLQSTTDNLIATDASLAPGPLNTHYSVTNLFLNIEQANWSWNNWYWENNNAGNGQGAARTLDNSGKENIVSFMSQLQYRSIIDQQTSIEGNTYFHYLDGESQLTLFPANSRIPIGSDGNPFTAPGNLINFPDGVIGIPAGTTYRYYFDLGLQYIGIVDHILHFQTGAQSTQFRSREQKNFGPGILTGTEISVDGTLTDVSGSPNSYITNQDRQNFFLAVQDQWHITPDVTLTLGGRLDHYSDFGSTFNPRAGVVWEPSPDFTGKLLYGEAFRAPSFSELYLKNNPSGIGSSSLKPEQIKSYEIVTDWIINPELQLTNTLFLYKASELIKTELKNNVLVFQNTGANKGYGIESEFKWQLDHNLSLKGYYSHLKSKNSNTNKTIADIPRNTAYLALNSDLPGKWQINLSNHWIGSSSRQNGDNRENRGSYTWTTLKASKQSLIPGLKLAVIVKNLFDKEAFAPSSSTIPGDYPLEGRSVWGELTYRY
ncbi:TonB-dependent receptor [Oceanospirillum sp. MED92]|uniref:TonB-dependent receptor n=1 Tax=Neptuniibacter caesariensis TaxID=207954 RepID=A0A7U8C6Q8_NEPCE|nr:TonB-dependent receptor [Oceanospirillum sp. MED92] [Neptuniibacter caesariensis]